MVTNEAEPNFDQIKLNPAHRPIDGDEAEEQPSYPDQVSGVAKHPPTSLPLGKKTTKEKS